jgi:hypothetical protein
MLSVYLELDLNHILPPNPIMPLLLSEEDHVILTRLEEDMWREVTRFDRTFQAQRFAADFFEFGRSGRVYTRDLIIQLDSQPIHAIIPLPNLAIRLLDRNTAQVTYNSQVEYDSVVEYARRSSIWSRTESGWVMRFHQGTPYQPIK